MILSRAWRVIRRELGVVLAVSCALLPIGVAMLPCLLGVPVLAYALRKLTVALLRAAQDDRTTGDSSAAWTGAYALAGLAILATSMLAGAAIAQPLLSEQSSLVRQAVMFVLALVAAIGTGAAMAPFALAPFVLADGGRGFLRPLTRSFELAARLGPRRTLRLGATAGALTGASLLAVMGIFVATAPDTALSSAMLAAPFGIIPGPPLAGALLADAYVEACALPERTIDAPASTRLRALAMVLAPAVALTLAAIVLAGATPTPMRAVAMHEPVRRGLHGAGLSADAQRRDLPGGRAFARTTEHGVSLEAYDGGGSGAVDARFDTTQSALFLEAGERYGGARGTTAVIVSGGDREWALTIVDADGVRQDDGIGARVMGRLGFFGSCALAVGALLLLVLAWRIGVDLGEARALDVPDLGAVGRGTLAALEGTLRLGEGAHVARASAGLERAWMVEGDAWLEADGGALRFKLPEGRAIPALGALEAPENGSALVLLSRFAQVAPAGLRSAGTPWPSDARLVVGRRADAAHALVRRATAVASWITLPCVLCLGGAVAALLAGL